MPGMDGIGVLRALRAGKAEAVPVVVVSAFSPAHGARAVDALAEGAFDLVAKPALGESMETFTAGARPQGRRRDRERHARARRARCAAPGPRRTSPRRSRRVPPPRPRARHAARRWSLIASSTGGPKALGELIPKLPVAARHAAR